MSEETADVCPRCGSHYTERESGEDRENGAFIGVWWHCYWCGLDFYVEAKPEGSE